MIEYLLLAPILTGIICLFTKTQKQVETVNGLGSVITLILGFAVVNEVLKNGTIIVWNGLLFADALSALVVIIITLIGFVTAVYSIGYMRHELLNRAISTEKLRTYYVLLHIFIFTMLLVVLSNNIGLMWIAIEMTTLVSALMIMLYTTKASVEASWKYVIICTVGITFALFGTMLTYYAAVNILGDNEALNWTSLVAVANQFDPALMKLAFVFILIGYGTKAGLAPMHTWLPDAHSEAPTPVSALLSGVLLKCAMYGILRFYIITGKSTGTGFTGSLLIAFGLFSIAIVTPFILMQNNVKRLLAYHSVEHIGIISIGFGFGVWFGIYGALLHMLNHAVTKTLMFFTVGNINQKFGTKEIDKISGVLNVMPFTGITLIIGALALAGSPPFGIFLSEFMVLSTGFFNGKVIPVVLLLLLIIIIFAGVVHHMSSMAFGDTKTKIEKGDVSRKSMAVMALLVAMIVILGFYIPPDLNTLLNMAVRIVSG